VWIRQQEDNASDVGSDSNGIGACCREAGRNPGLRRRWQVQGILTCLAAAWQQPAKGKDLARAHVVANNLFRAGYAIAVVERKVHGLAGGRFTPSHSGPQPARTGSVYKVRDPDS
jgi:hypothetical protein